MGTYYQVVTRSDECQVQTNALEARLNELNQSLSTYLPDSELSQLNRAGAGQPIDLSRALDEVLQAAELVWHESGGAFDVTIGPLVNLWGFGPGKAADASAPSASFQAQARARVGMHLLSLADGKLVKQRPDTYIDLSALAKGYAVDDLAALLKDAGCRNFMVDIGGEIFAHGLNTQGKAWRLGIESPVAGQPGQIHAVVELSNLAIATSGDYRNFRMVDGEPVDHVLDPRTGQPAASPVVSATVLHSSAMWADAYATAFMVLGEEASMNLAEQLNLPVYLIMRVSEPKAPDPWRIRYNGQMAEKLQNPVF